jgi:hypothetical protein
MTGWFSKYQKYSRIKVQHNKVNIYRKTNCENLKIPEDLSVYRENF